MFKKLTALMLILAVILLTGCFARQELRPQRNSDEVWVCKEIDNTYFYWDKEKECFLGTLTYNEEEFEFVLACGSGLDVNFVNFDILEKNKIKTKHSFIYGFADYQENLMPIEITEDKLNIFNGEIDTLTFVPMDKDEYFESKENNQLILPIQ